MTDPEARGEEGAQVRLRRWTASVRVRAELLRIDYGHAFEELAARRGDGTQYESAAGMRFAIPSSLFLFSRFLLQPFNRFALLCSSTSQAYFRPTRRSGGSNDSGKGEGDGEGKGSAGEGGTENRDDSSRTDSYPPILASRTSPRSSPHLSSTLFLFSSLISFLLLFSSPFFSFSLLSSELHPPTPTPNSIPTTHLNKKKKGWQNRH